jgi:transposase InsO family protein
MSRRGNCGENTLMESFFGTLKTELDEYPDRDAARGDLFAYLEATTIVGGSTLSSAKSPPNKPRQNPRNPVSTFPGEGQFEDNWAILRN